MDRRPASLPGASDATDLTRALLARLGLPPGATGEDIEDARAELVNFLRSAPAGARPWARQQIANVEAAAVLLRGPEAGLATDASAWTGADPATEDEDDSETDSGPEADAETSADTKTSAKAMAAPAPRQPRLASDDLTDEELEAYERGEQPEDQDDSDSGATGAARRPSSARRPAAAAKKPVRGPRTSRPVKSARQRRSWRPRPVYLAVAFLVLAGIVYTVYNTGSRGAVPGISATATASPSTQAVDQATVAALMSKLSANPKDVATLRSLGDIYFAAGDYRTASDWQKKIIAVNPSDVTARLALGAAEFNMGDTTDAEQEWLKVVALNPRQAEAHYDLGFLYLSENPPNLAKVRSEWNTVISIDPNSAIAKNVATHLKTLESQSASPSASSSASPSASPSASGSAGK